MEPLFARALQQLSTKGDSVAIIRIVERWVEVGNPPLDARLIEARALLDLRLMDRAWVRLREVTDQKNDHVEGLVLLGRMFLDRGWPQRAKRVVERLEQLGANHPELDTLRAGASSAASQLPADAPQIEREGSTDAQVRLAESYLASGSVIRGQAILERLARAGADHPRLAPLLWGIRGEFVSRHQSPQDLLNELVPGLVGAQRFGGFLPTAELDHAEPETAESSRFGGLVEAEGPGSFPNLFRKSGGGEKAEELGEDDEVTMATHLASLQEMADPPEREMPDPEAIAPDLGGDTQIMQVINSGGGRRLGAVEGPLHEKKGDNADQKLRSTLDLRAWQQEMGVDTEEPEDGFLEEEDQDVVVITRREERPVVAPPPVERRGPVEVINKTPVVVEAPRAPAPPRVDAPPPAVPPVNPPEPAVEVVRAPPVPRRLPWPALVLIGAFLALVLAGGGAVVGRWAWRSGHGDASSAALLGGDLAEVQALSQTLSARVRTGDGGGLELARLEGFRGALLDGSPEVRAAAEAALAHLPDGAQGAAAARAFARYAEGDLEGARALAETEASTDALAAGLAARVALDGGEPAAALSLLDGNPGQGAWLSALRAEALGAQGQVEAARQALESEPESPWIRLARGSFEWAEPKPEARLAILRALADDQATPPKLAALAWLRLRDLHQAGRRMEAAREALEFALKRDAYGGEPLLVASIARYESGDERGALALLERCRGARPKDGGCLRGQVQILIHQGRATDALAISRAANQAGLSAGLLEAWCQLNKGTSGRALSVAREGATAGGRGPLDSAALAAWMLAVAAQARGEAHGGLEDARQALIRSLDPWDRALGAHPPSPGTGG